MTAGTACRRTAVIEALDHPLLGGVARVAGGLGSDMPGRFTLGANTVVAIRADLWRSLKAPACMTGFTA